MNRDDQPPDPRTLPATDAFELLGIAPARARILRHFLVRPGNQPHARELQRVLGLGGASLERELERLRTLGALERIRDGNRVRYSVVDTSRIWTAMRLIAGESRDATTLLRDALSDVGGVQAAFVFGSTARGTQRPDSDIDLFVVEEATVEGKKLLRQLAELEMITRREVNTVRYTAQSLAERLGDPQHPGHNFVREALTGPKWWIAGSAAAVLPLMTAAGLQMRETTAA